MNWLNLELTTLRSEEYLGSDPVQRATWLNLLAYCADQENGGRIAGAEEWGSRRWLQIVGVTKEEVETVSALWRWKEGVLHVWKYPRAKEAEVRAKRVAGRRGGRPPKTKGEKPDGIGKQKPSGLTELKGSRNGIGKEGNRKGIGREVEKKNTSSCPEPQNDSGPDFEKIFLTFSCTGTPREYHLLKSKLAEYREVYDTLDVEREVKKAHQWLVDNPTHRKTARGMPRFLCNWMSRSADRGGSRSEGRTVKFK
jgi:hypothetical protein